MRTHVPEEYSNPLVVPTKYRGPYGIPTLGWLSAKARMLGFLPEPGKTILTDAALGVQIHTTAQYFDLSHDRIEHWREEITALLMGTSILHAVRIGLEASLIDPEVAEYAERPRLPDEHVRAFDLLSRGYTTKQVAKLEHVETASIHSRMKRVYEGLGVRPIIPATTHGYPANLLVPLSPGQQLPQHDPVLSALPD